MANYESYVDGASRGYGESDDGKGEGSAGVMFYTNNKLIGQVSRLLGRVTNDEAEYEAVYMAVYGHMSAGHDNPRIYSDSERVVNQITGVWDCDPQSELYPSYLSVMRLMDVYSFTLVKVGRRAVGHVDHMIKLSLDALEKDREQHVRPFDR